MPSRDAAAPVFLDGTCELSPEVVGGKASSINRLAALGFPTPPAFTLATDMCKQFYDASGRLPAQAEQALTTGIAWLEEQTGRGFGGATRPLLLSVRSGAARSMPGMMDTVLNIGTNDVTAGALSRETGDSAYAEDLTRRLGQQFRSVVGAAPPSDVVDQLRMATTAVFESWMSPRARAYRHHHGLTDEGGTAVTVQAMVFGNLDDASGSGVLFSRNPMTGEREPFGEWLPRAQGEDIVSGRCTPLPLSELARAFPGVHRDLLDVAQVLENDAADVQDIEFTVESEQLYVLQTRRAKRSPDAAVRLAVAFEQEGLIDRDQALQRLSVGDVRSILRSRLDPVAVRGALVLARGEPASPGHACGIAVGTPEEAEDKAEEGINAVLVRPTTDPEDLHGMIASTAIVTEIGGSTSHAAVVSRELGRPCVVGCGGGTVTRLLGRLVTVDGAEGTIYEGELPVVDAARDDPAVLRIAEWLGADDVSAVPALLMAHHESTAVA